MGYQGLETGHRDVASHVVRQGTITFVFKTALNPNNKIHSHHLALHGDAVNGKFNFSLHELWLILRRCGFCV